MEQYFKKDWSACILQMNISISVWIMSTHGIKSQEWPKCHFHQQGELRCSWWLTGADVHSFCHWINSNPYVWKPDFSETIQRWKPEHCELTWNSMDFLEVTPKIWNSIPICWWFFTMWKPKANQFFIHFFASQSQRFMNVLRWWGWSLRVDGCRSLFWIPRCLGQNMRPAGIGPDINW